MRFLEKGNEGNATAENATVACEHGVLKDALCHCNIGWTGEACDLAVKLPPKKDEAPKATVDYQYSAEDRWVCPQGCSTHGKCDEEARTCSCEVRCAAAGAPGPHFGATVPFGAARAADARAGSAMGLRRAGGTARAASALSFSQTGPSRRWRRRTRCP